MYSPIQMDRLYEKIVEIIEEQIVKGELKVGDQLPPERELAAKFGVSRTAVREAVKALHQKGLVDIIPGRGTFISDRTSQAVRLSLGFMLRLNSEDSFRNLVEVREILEPEIASLASLRATAEDLAAMAQAIAAMDVALRDPELFIEADLDFHLALAQAVQNPIIPILMDPIVDLLREQRKRIFNSAGAPERGQVYHKRILEAVRNHNPKSAREAMHEHLRQVREDSYT